MFRKHIFVLLIATIFISLTPLCAQISKHAVYGGAGLLYSGSNNGEVSLNISYEYKLRNRPEGIISSIGLRTGATFVNDKPLFGPGGTLLIPVNAVFLTGRNNHHVDVALGTFLLYTPRDNGYAPVLLPLPLVQAGYRYEPLEGGLIVRMVVGIDALAIAANLGVGWAF